MAQDDILTTPLSIPGSESFSDFAAQNAQNTPAPGSTADLEARAAQAPGQLGQALQDQQAQVAQAQQPQPTQRPGLLDMVGEMIKPHVVAGMYNRPPSRLNVLTDFLRTS